MDFTLDQWGDPAVEVPVLKREIRAAIHHEDTSFAALLLFELGRITLASGDEIRAAQKLLRAYTLRPQFRPTLRTARLIYENRGDAPLQLKLLDAEARATRDPLLRCALLRQQAHILWLQQGDHVGARERLEEALRLDAASLSTLRLLQVIDRQSGQRSDPSLLKRQLEVVADEGLRAAILGELALFLAEEDPDAALETIQKATSISAHRRSALHVAEYLHWQRGEFAALARVREELAEIPGVSPEWAARLRARAAVLYRHVGDQDQYLAQLRASLRLETDALVASDAFAALAPLGDHEATLEVGAVLFDALDDNAEQAAVATQLGDICRLRLGQAERATKWYRRALSLAPAYQPALEGISGLIEAGGEIEALLKIHRADTAAATTPSTRAHGLFRIATLLERHGRDEEAIEIHREGLGIHPGYAPSQMALQLLLSAKERWTEVLQLHETELQRDPPAERRTHIYQTMASIWLHHLDRRDRALECYLQMVETAPNDLPSIRAAARLCAEEQRWSELVALNEREVGISIDPQRKAELLQRSGELCEERLLDLDRAIESYQRALDHNPEYLPALRALGRLYRQKGRWHDLIEMHRTEAAATSDPEHVVSLLSTVAEVYEEELLDVDASADTHRLLLERRRDHLPSIEALARVLETRGHWHELVELLEGTLESYEDPADQATRLWRAGIVRETRLQDPGGAAECYERGLRLAPDLGPLQAAQLRLLERARDYPRLVELHGLMMDQTSDEGHRTTLSASLADVLERQDENPRRTALLYERSAEGDTPPLWSLWSLARIYGQEGSHAEQRRALERIGATSSDARARRELLLRVGMLRHLHQATDPLPPLQMAKDLASGGIFARDTIELHLREGGPSEGLEQAIEERIQRTKDPLEVAILNTEIAELLDKRRDETAAEGRFRQALNCSRSHLPAIWGLAQLLERQERWRERAELAEVEASCLESPDELANELFEAGVLWQDRLEDTARALELYSQAMNVRPGHEEAYQRVHSLHGARKDWGALTLLIRGQISAIAEDGRRAELFKELGHIYSDSLNDGRKAEMAFRRAVEISPYDPEALISLGKLHEGDRQWDSAVEMFGRAEMVVADASARAEVQRRLGRVYRHLGQLQPAQEALQRASSAIRDPDHELLKELADVAAERQDGAVEADVRALLADRVEDEKERIDLRRRVAVLAEETLDDDDRAVTAWQQLLALDPLDLQATERLAAIYGRIGHRAAADQHLHAAVSHHRAELARTPFETRLYKQVSAIFRWQRAFDPLYCAYIALSQLSGVGESELTFLRDYGERCNGSLPPAITPEQYDRLLLPRAARGPLRELWHRASGTLLKTLAVPASRIGLRRGDRLGAKHPLNNKVARIAEVLQVPTVELWRLPKAPDAVVAAMLTKPALLVHEEVVERAEKLSPRDRFRIGHGLMELAEGAILLRGRPVRMIQAFVLALASLADQELELQGVEASAADVEQESARIAPALGRRERRKLREVLADLAVPLGQGDLAEQTRALGSAAYRGGLIVSGDPLSAMRAALEMEEDRRSKQLADLLLYLVGADYLRLRQELGIAPQEQI